MDNENPNAPRPDIKDGDAEPENKADKFFRAGDTVFRAINTGINENSNSRVTLGDGDYIILGIVEGTITEGVPSHSLELLKKIGSGEEYFLREQGVAHFSVTNPGEGPVRETQSVEKTMIEVKLV